MKKTNCWAQESAAKRAIVTNIVLMPIWVASLVFVCLSGNGSAALAIGMVEILLLERLCDAIESLKEARELQKEHEGSETEFGTVSEPDDGVIRR